MSIKLGIAPVKSSLSTCSPDLMPFHIDYSGPAQLSTYMRVDPAKETVGAPANIPDSSDRIGDSTPPHQTDEVAEDSAECTQKTEHDPSQPSQQPAPAIVADTPKRFISTFRGRTIHALDISLPEGYTGLILRADDQSSGNSSSALSKDNDRRHEKNARTRVKRVTRREKTLVAQDETGEIGLEMSEKVVHDVEMVDLSEDVHEEEDDEELPTRTLSPVAQFSSFRLWNADFPADGGVDEYARTLTEWITLAHHIHQAPP